jgi:hypothetical protein
MIKILRPVVCLVIVSSAIQPARAQTLGDAARRAEEERAKAKQAGKVFTNKDVGDAPAPPPSTGANAPASTNDSAGATPARNRLDPVSAPDAAPVSASDGRIDVRRVGTLRGNGYETSLSLPLRGSKQPVPSTLILRAVHDDRLPFSNTPSDLTAEFAMNPTFGGRVSMKPPHIVFIADEGTIVFTGSVDPGQPIGSFLTVIIPIDLGMLSRLERASKIRGRLFDLEFVFTPGQLRLMNEFSQRARRNPAAGI